MAVLKRQRITGVVVAASAIGALAAIAITPKHPPVDDSWGHPILYHASRGHYALRSTGRDGRNDRLRHSSRVPRKAQHATP